MSETTHTPGPWRTGRTDMQSYRASDGVPEIFVYRGEEERIPVYGENCWPDARLIAAAPELLEALQALTDPEGHIWHGTSGACTGECKAVRAALAKAEGREP